MKQTKRSLEVKSLNSTESRLFTLLLNLLKYKKGLTFLKIQSLMREFYSNQENPDSDRKKFQRDLDELQALGFKIKFYASKWDFNGEEHFLYVLEQSSTQQSLKLSDPEAKTLLQSILNISPQDLNPDEVFQLCQKLFYQSWESLDWASIKKKHCEGSSLVIEDANPKVLKIIQSITTKTPLEIQYKAEKRLIEPHSLIKKGIQDFYLLAFDRNKQYFRKFIVSRIESIALGTGDFFNHSKPQEKDLNLHPITFQIHPPVSVEISLDPDTGWRLLANLFGMEYNSHNHSLQITVTNKEALFQILLKSLGSFSELSPSSIQDEWNQYRQTVLSFYSH